MREKHIDSTTGNDSIDYSAYYNEEMKPIPLFVQQALEQSPFPADTIPAFSQVQLMQTPGYSPVETGYTVEQDGSVHIAVLTSMPGCVPEMWDWWFGWHGCRADRYKLWHPASHLDAQWEDGRDDVGYIGRTSIIEERIGKSVVRGAIQFRSPTELGFSSDHREKKSELDKVVYICARLGHATLPIDIGWLVHQVRAVEGGSEMRSRFWIGGGYTKLRTSGRVVNRLSRLIQHIQIVSPQQARDILTHCAEEMNHLASFLPMLHSQFKHQPL
jgi:hypothetical protein